MSFQKGVESDDLVIIIGGFTWFQKVLGGAVFYLVSSNQASVRKRLTVKNSDFEKIINS